MNRHWSKLRVAYIGVAAACAIMAATYGATILSLPKILEVTRVHNLGLVTYSNGKTEVVYYDYDYASVQPGWYRYLTVDAIPEVSGSQRPRYHAPSFAFQGSAWNGEVYTFNDPELVDCSSNIIFINREAKSQEELNLFNTGYCILATLDTGDEVHGVLNPMHFLATQKDNQELLVGNFQTGQVTHGMPMPLTGFSGQVLADLAVQRVAFMSGTCDREQNNLHPVLWDLSSGTVQDRIDLITERCDGSRLDYDAESNQFILKNDHGKSIVL